MKSAHPLDAVNDIAAGKACPASSVAVTSHLSNGERTIAAAQNRRGFWFLTCVVGLLLAFVFGFLLGQWRIDERWSTSRWGVVVPGGVYRSGQLSQFRVEGMLREHSIATVIDLSGFKRHDADQLVELAVAEYLEIDHYRFPLAGDGRGDINHYVSAVAKIAECERAGKPVLVHCAAGSYRTGGVVAVYSLLVRGDSPEQVMEEMAAYGCTPTDNPKLVNYLNEHMEFFARELANRRVIEHIPDELPQLRP